LLDAALELVWPTRCAGCERPGELLCPECAAALEAIEQEHACPACGAPFGFKVCTECYSSQGKESFAFSQAICAISLEELSGRIIVLYKDDNERRLSEALAKILCSALPPSWLEWAHVISWIPTDKRTYRRRGFDHMELLAAAVAGTTGLPHRQFLNKQKSHDQRSLNRKERKINLSKSFSLNKEAGAPPPHILLLDDVFTTGSTLDAAAAS
jgi:ComF family protein